MATQYKVVSPWLSTHGQRKPTFAKGDTISAADATKDGADIDNLLYIGAVEPVEDASKAAASGGRGPGGRFAPKGSSAKSKSAKSKAAAAPVEPVAATAVQTPTVASNGEQAQ